MTALGEQPAKVNSMTISPAEFMMTAPRSLEGSSPWAVRYARELRGVIKRQASLAPRSVQVSLGPSELGEQCDRQVAGKFAAVTPTNHVSDPWPSIVGTAVHAWLALAFEDDNLRENMLRWVTEVTVTPHPEFPGHADLYDAREQAVVDHKVLGPTSLAKVKSPEGPPLRYQVQLLLYAAGFRNLGLPVRRIVLAAYPRTASTLDGMYVWDHVCGPDDTLVVQEVIRKTLVRRQLAEEIRAGRMAFRQVPATPDGDACFFCLGGETEVVTRDGIRTIRDLSIESSLLRKDPVLLVPGQGSKGGLKARGHFQAAQVMPFGNQKLYEITLKSRRATKVIRATAEHRWILAAGKGWEFQPQEACERTTRELRPGDRLRPLRVQVPGRAQLMPVAAAQGFTYGDGTVGQDERPATLAIYDNGKDEAMLPFFPMAQPREYPREAGGWATGPSVRMIYGLPRFWKDLPPLRESRTFLLSWLAGYFAADGDVTESGQATLSSASYESIRFVRDVLAICGIGSVPIRKTVRPRIRMPDGYTVLDNHVIWTLNLRRRDLPDWFFLIEEHRIRAVAADEQPARDTYWTVENVTDTGLTEPVYCAVVPGVRAFGLADDLMTGNCPFYRPQAAYDDGPGCPGTIVLLYW